jgi:hypothetical protein
MSKRTLLSALLISTFSISSPSAAAELKETKASMPGAEQTVMKFTAHSKRAEQSILAICDQTCPTFPFARTGENNADQIAIKNSTLEAMDPWFFQDNPSLKRVAFDGSTINLQAFSGQTFLTGFDAIESVSFKGTTGVDLATFLEQYASPTLLQRILDRKCKLFIELAETGATMANFERDGVVTQDAIHFAIRTAKILEVIAVEQATASTKPKGWLSIFTFGYLGE